MLAKFKEEINHYTKCALESLTKVQELIGKDYMPGSVEEYEDLLKTNNTHWVKLGFLKYLLAKISQTETYPK